LVNGCPNCKSVWLDVGELDKLKKGEQLHPEELLKQARTELTRAAERPIEYVGMCPRCGGQMTPYIEDGVALDTCLACHGMFFDYGELEKVLKDREEDSWLMRLWKAMRGDRTDE
jgi:Zn-finger nucleic acid-binding protein